MASTGDFKPGYCFEMNGDLLQIVDFQHVKPGKGGAFVRTKLKSLKSGKIFEYTFNSGEKVTEARVETREYQFLYKESDMYHFMHNETFEQVSVSEDIITGYEYLKEGQVCLLLVHADTETVLSVELPAYVVLKIEYTEPAVKGNTASNAQKKATLETGAIINVPLFIEQDEIIKVDTREGRYSERVKA
ncbi:MAG: elongation factor P [Cytophagales bacterium]|nr:elongation factor P [Cytophagales bacterium]